MIKFLAELPCGEPMVFELYGEVQTLLESNELSVEGLLPVIGVNKSTSGGKGKEAVESTSVNNGGHASERPSHAKSIRRPRERRPFLVEASSSDQACDSISQRPGIDIGCTKVTARGCS